MVKVDYAEHAADEADAVSFHVFSSMHLLAHPCVQRSTLPGCLLPLRRKELTIAAAEMLGLVKQRRKSMQEGA